MTYVLQFLRYKQSEQIMNGQTSLTAMHNVAS